MKTIIDLLNKEDWCTDDDYINVALGKYKAPENWKEYKHFRKIRRNGRK